MQSKNQTEMRLHERETMVIPESQQGAAELEVPPAAAFPGAFLKARFLICFTVLFFLSHTVASADEAQERDMVQNAGEKSDAGSACAEDEPDDEDDNDETSGVELFFSSRDHMLPDIVLNEEDIDGVFTEEGFIPEMGYTPLHATAREGYTETVRRLLAEHEIDVNAATEKFRVTPLHLATEYGYAEIVELLLAEPAIDVNVKTTDGNTPLHVAAWEGRTKVTRLLLVDPSIAVNEMNWESFTPLKCAALRGHTEIVRLLLAAPGIDVNAAETEETPSESMHIGGSPLHAAAWMDRTEIARLLLAAPGIDVNAADEDGRTPLREACEEGYTEIEALLRAASGAE